MQTADAEANRVSDGFESPDFLSPAAGQYKLLSIFSRDIPQRLFLSRSTCNMRYWHDFFFILQAKTQVYKSCDVIC